MAVENYLGKDKKISKPAGKNDEFSIMPIIWTQVLVQSKDNDKKEKKKIIATKGKVIESPLSTDLAQGQSIKAYDNIAVKSQDDDYVM